MEKRVKPKISRNLAYYRQHKMIFEEKINKPIKIETDSEGRKMQLRLDQEARQHQISQRRHFEEFRYKLQH